MTAPRRRWFAFSMREILLATAVTGLCLGWWMDHRRLAGSQEYIIGDVIVSTIGDMRATKSAGPVPFIFTRRPIIKHPFRADITILPEESDPWSESRQKFELEKAAAVAFPEGSSAAQPDPP